MRLTIIYNDHKDMRDMVAFVDSEQLREIMSVLKGTELDPRSPTLREADGDTCPYCEGKPLFNSRGERVDCVTCKNSGHV